MLVNYERLYNAIYTDIITHCYHLTTCAKERAHRVCESLLKDENILQNGYKITFNEAFNEWQTSHPEIGMTEAFKTLQEAVIYCNKG